MLDLHKDKYIEIERLLRSGAQTFLLVGDYGVGKKTLVRRIMSASFPEYMVNEIPKFTIDVARQMKANTLRKAMQVRVYLIDGDESTNQAYNAVLKLFEEPPAATIFFVCSSSHPLSTIVSRCNNIRIPPLSMTELGEVLSFKGMSGQVASTVISYANGSISQAFRVYEKFEEKRRLVPFIKALKDRDLQFVLTQAKTIGRDDIHLLLELVDDVILARYGLVAPELATLVRATPDFLIKMKEALLAGSNPTINWLRAYFETT